MEASDALGCRAPGRPNSLASRTAVEFAALTGGIGDCHPLVAPDRRGTGQKARSPFSPSWLPDSGESQFGWGAAAESATASPAPAVCGCAPEATARLAGVKWRARSPHTECGSVPFGIARRLSRRERWKERPIRQPERSSGRAQARAREHPVAGRATRKRHAGESCVAGSMPGQSGRHLVLWPLKAVNALNQSQHREQTQAEGVGRGCAGQPESNDE
eukprot:scaffold12586_cov132-Isochrysis_galbana.AAC.10